MSTSKTCEHQFTVVQTVLGQTQRCIFCGVDAADYQRTKMMPMTAPRSSMSGDERNLLLATARILRAFMRESRLAEASDLDDLDEALAPFGPSNVTPINTNGCTPSKP